MAEPYLGEIRMFGGNFAPANWALCNGQLLSIAEYETLYALIGTTYGGNGVTTFALPDLCGRIPVHQGKATDQPTDFVIGQKAGVESVFLTKDNLPAHTHTVTCSSQLGTKDSPSGAVWAKQAQEFSTNAPEIALNAASISSVGGNQPHENLMPFGVVTFIIAVHGVYPSQD